MKNAVHEDVNVFNLQQNMFMAPNKGFVLENNRILYSQEFTCVCKLLQHSFQTFHIIHDFTVMKHYFIKVFFIKGLHVLV